MSDVYDMPTFDQVDEMSDDLIKRLRGMDGDSMSIKTLDEAADFIEELGRDLAKAVVALIAEREANLWNAYNIGVEYGGRWSDACMSDAEWLVDQCGLDPEFKDHDANAIKAAIPTAARRVLAELEAKE